MNQLYTPAHKDPVVIGCYVVMVVVWVVAVCF